MGKKLRFLFIIASFGLFVFIASKSIWIQIRKVAAVPGSLQLGSQTTSTTYINNDAIYNSNLFFGGGTGGRGGKLDTTGAVYIVPTGTPDNSTVLIVNDRTKTNTLSVGTSNNTNNVEVGGNSNFNGNVGIGVANNTTGAYTTPLTVYKNAASPTLMRMIGSDGTVIVGESGADLTVNNDIRVAGSGTSYFSAGKVGIGTTSPVARLDVVQNDLEAARFYGTGTYSGYIGMGYHPTGDYGMMGTYNTGGTAKSLAINPNGGNIGIGVAPSTFKLDVNGTFQARGSSANVNTDATGNLYAQGALTVGSGSLDGNFRVYKNSGAGGRNTAVLTNGTPVAAGVTKSSVIQFKDNNNATQIEMGNDRSVNGDHNFYIYDGVSAADRLFIASNGNVGINTTSPGYPLHLYKSGAETGILTTFTSSNIYLSHGGWGVGAGKFGIGSGSSPTILMDTINNNVGIGSTAPTYKLDVAGEIRSQSRLSVNAPSDTGGSVSIWNTQKTGAGVTNNWTIWNMTGGYGNALKFWRYNADGANAGAALTLWDNGLTQFVGSVRGGGTANSLRIDTGNGFVDIGPQNGSYVHFGTDRAQYYFDHTIQVNGSICRYTGGCAPIAGDSNQGDWQFASNTNGQSSYPYASIELRESNFGGAGYTPPRLSFHWGGVVASQIGIASDGTIQILNNPGTGFEKLRAGQITPDAISFSGSGTYAYNAFHGVTSGTIFKENNGYMDWVGLAWYFRNPYDDVANSGFYMPSSGYDSFTAERITAFYGFNAQSTSQLNGDVTIGQYDMWAGTLGNLTILGVSTTGMSTNYGNRGYGADAWLRFVQAGNLNAYHQLAVGVFWANGQTRFDLAEVTPVDETENLLLGELVSPNPEHNVQLHRSKTAYDKTVMGIVSDVNTASMTIGGDLSPEQTVTVKNKRPIALGGRVTTIVNLENGPIKIGDSITTSHTPGHGMKAVKSGAIISKAMEDFDGSRVNSQGVEEIIAKVRKDLAAAKPGTTDRKSYEQTLAMLTAPLPAGTGRIITFISSSQYDPDAYLADTGDYYINKVGEEYKVQSKSGSVIDRIGVFAELLSAKLKAGAIETQKLIVNGVDILKKLNDTEAKLNETRKTVEEQGKTIEELKKALQELQTKK